MFWVDADFALLAAVTMLACVVLWRLLRWPGEPDRAVVGPERRGDRDARPDAVLPCRDR